MNQNEKMIANFVRFEPYVLGLFCATFFIKLARMPYSDVLFIIACSTLAMIYTFKSSAKMDHLEAFARYIRKGYLYAVALGLIALLYYVQAWPFSKELMVVFLVISSACTVIAFVKNIQLKSLISMTEGIVLLGLTLLIVTSYLKLF